MIDLRSESGFDHDEVGHHLINAIGKERPDQEVLNRRRE
ncbi:hypothetical protein L509_0936 [Bordetella bronchiseptica M85/00/2]|nr:hypothetical protein L509_0936 [Bordetella bronchiseptica M85/00/2]